MLTGWRDCPRTRAYIDVVVRRVDASWSDPLDAMADRRVEIRQDHGMSDRDIRRCLRRYIASELFRALTAAGG